ncbi:MAG: hydrogenase maturation protease [Acidobacteriota bacterium]|nr:hydrogenase maturation protease [Acidobacteriota bacterium]
MTSSPARCVILACGNTLREDDGVGPWLAAWAEARFQSVPDLRILSQQQWTPEFAEDAARAESVIFIDCSAESAPGQVRLAPVAPADEPPGLATHHMGAAQLLSLGSQLYNSLPHTALLLTIGAGSLELREGFSDAVRDALPHACRLLEDTVLHQLGRV